MITACAEREGECHERGARRFYSTVTTSTGNYTLPSLPSGRYDMTVVAAGFSQYIQKGIDGSVAQTGRIDVVLKIGQASDSVTITADAPLLHVHGFVPVQVRRIDGVAPAIQGRFRGRGSAS